MRYSLLLLVLLVVGCTAQTSDPIVTKGTETDADAIPEVNVTTAAGDEMLLTPENTNIAFVGTHFGKDPDPDARHGSFEDFQGTAILSDGELQSVSLEIQMASVQTGMDKLNNHLQNEDFFSVREYPTAQFESSSVIKNDDGSHVITGNLTLHSKTQEISFPANVEVVDGELRLAAELVLDRTEFGMDKMTDKVNKEVSLVLSIGETESTSE